VTEEGRSVPLEMLHKTPFCSVTVFYEQDLPLPMLAPTLYHHSHRLNIGLKRCPLAGHIGYETYIRHIGADRDTFDNYFLRNI